MTRRIIIALVAIIAMFVGSLVAPVSASAEGGYTATFIRDKNNCYAGTVVIFGVPGRHNITVSTGWGPPKPYGGFEYTGRGGSKPAQWRKHFGVTAIGGRLHRDAFTMHLAFHDNRVDSSGVWTTIPIRVPSCKKK